MSMATPLQPLTMPLYGSRLIEASAGTGKTYTIAALYVRLVLGHGGESSFARPLTPDQILVVTFTEAATEELRDRIRERLATAASYFRQQHDSSDAFLVALRESYTDPQQWPALARRLDLAAQAMDEAAVHTIHGWCNRMLREHAFASGSLFTQALETDNSDLWLTVARDYWRQYFGTSSLPVYRFLRVHFASPEQLLSQVNTLQRYQSEAQQQQLLADNPYQELQQQLEQLQQLKNELLPAIEELRKDIPQHKGVTHHAGGMEKLYDWATTDVAQPDLSEAGWKRFSSEELSKKFKDKLHPDWHQIAQLQQRLSELQLAIQPVQNHAAASIAMRFQQLQEQRAQMGFDDILTRLRDALQGQHGKGLAAAIRAQFPIAMVDEFQDTDPVQYRIFDTIFELQQNHPQQGIFLIGDPKQAIYSFRDADIYTYLQARRATSGRHCTLGTNYRSTPAMVAAVNHVFDSANDYPKGAFRFRTETIDEVPFQAVEATAKDKLVQLHGEDLPGMTIRVSPLQEQDTNKQGLTETLAESCADDIVALLNEANYRNQNGETSRVQPGDIAVLVNKADEAQLIRQALRQRNLASVYLSDRDSVFASVLAKDVLLILQSCASPRDPGMLHAALATSLLGMSLLALTEVVEDETLWDYYAGEFIEYHQCWEQRGVLAMLQRLLHDFAVPQRLLNSTQQNGERELTDVLHLAELLQQQAQHADGMSGLVRYLAERVEQVQEQGRKTDATEQQVRLESDSNLVQVVTVHKSKGLQYPFVFLPFMSSQKALHRRIQYPAVYHNEQGELQLVLSKDDSAGRDQADAERLAEDIRKFYVAVTRAQYSTYIYAGHYKELGETALNYLLTGSRRACENLQLAMQESWSQQQAIRLLEIPAETEADQHPAQYQPTPTETQQPRYCEMPAGHQLERWWLSSYSALLLAPAADAGVVLAEQSADEQNSREEMQTEARALNVERAASTVPIHSFPKGPQAGTFLHNLLEAAANEGFAEVAASTAKCAELVSAHAQSEPWNAYQDVLVDWLQSYLNTHFELVPGASISLASLTSYQAEPEFWFATRNTNVQQLDKLIQQYILPGHARPSLQPTTLNGMMKGFIDLVFAHNDQFYVADNKSNWLGDHEQDYTLDAMRERILHSRYDVQYVIYTVALHKLLRARLGAAYNYDTHVGGALYLFMRGYQADSAGGFFDRPPLALITELEALLQ